MRVFVTAICFAVGIAATSSAVAAGRYYYAACLHESHGFVGFNGPRHRDASDAAKDCDAHLKIYPRHRCSIAPIDY
jgi:hypothetical protein